MIAGTGSFLVSGFLLLSFLLSCHTYNTLSIRFARLNRVPQFSKSIRTLVFTNFLG